MPEIDEPGGQSPPPGPEVTAPPRNPVNASVSGGRDAAVQFIVGHIATHGGENEEVAAREVISAGELAGYTERVLIRARHQARAKIGARKASPHEGNGWRWYLLDPPEELLEDSGRGEEDSGTPESSNSHPAGDDDGDDFDFAAWAAGGRRSIAPSPAPAPVPPAPFVGDIDPYWRAALNGETAEVAAAPEGCRNDTLNKAALKLAGLVRDGHLPRAATIDALQAAAASCGLPEGEATATIKSAFSAADKAWHREKPPGDEYPTAFVLETGEAENDAQGLTWRPIDLGPYLRGEIERPKPTAGVRRSDGCYAIYPGREHAVIGETECGKTWFALTCAAAEMQAGNTVVYVHFEEADPGSTIERLRLLGVSDELIAAQLRFVGPSEQVRREWLGELLVPAPALVILDGVNEAMALHGAEIAAAEGASEFRRRLVVPCLRVGAATLACDHLPKSRDNRNGRDAFGSVHKGNAIDGARFILENTKSFGRGLCGVSHVYVTKDRPGHLRGRGTSTKVPGKTYFGTFVVDDCVEGPDFRVGFYAPSDRAATALDHPDGGNTAIVDAICAVLATVPGGTVKSKNSLVAHLRVAGHRFRKTDVLSAIDDAVVIGRLEEVSTGSRGSAVGFQLTNQLVPGEGGGND
ncbi:MAG: hypothetical protein WBA50_10730 [Mycobacterium sp.]